MYRLSVTVANRVPTVERIVPGEVSLVNPPRGLYPVYCRRIVA